MCALSGVPNGPRITVPVNPMLPTAPDTETIAALAAAVSGWLSQNRRYLSGPDATLDFEIILYSTLPGDVRPLLKIEDAFITIDKVS